LTLPGIAGIVLTLAMAIDANVLIYERAREETQAGKQIKRALSDGYKNALSAIVDSNLTTVISGIILFYFGTGPIRGFATTLLIGILCSFFTAIFLSRFIFETFILNKEKLHGYLTFTTEFTKNWLQNTKFNFIGNRNLYYNVTLGIAAVLIISLFTLGLKQGIDFSGGRNYIVRFEQTVKTTEIAGLLENSFEDESVSVITIGASNQVRISTNFNIEDNSEEADKDIANRIYEGLLPMLNKEVPKELFISGYRITQDGQIISSTSSAKGDSYGLQSSQKVGPTMADDIKTSAILAVILALLGIGLYIFIRFRNISFSLGSVAGLSFDALIIMNKVL
jgi:SecD/SecF fusion protein